MRLDSGLVWRIRDVGRFSRNRVVLVFDPKDGWLVVAWRLIPSISGLGKWLKRQLEFRDEQRIPGAVGGGKGPAYRGE